MKKLKTDAEQIRFLLNATPEEMVQDLVDGGVRPDIAVVAIEQLRGRPVRYVPQLAVIDGRAEAKK